MVRLVLAQPILNHEACHELKMAIGCQHNQAVQASYGSDLRIHRRDKKTASLLLCLDASKHLSGQFIEGPKQ